MMLLFQREMRADSREFLRCAAWEKSPIIHLRIRAQLVIKGIRTFETSKKRIIIETKNQSANSNMILLLYVNLKRVSKNASKGKCYLSYLCTNIKR